MTLVQGQLIYSNPHRLFLCVCVECVGGENEVSEMPSLFHFTHSFFFLDSWGPSRDCLLQWYTASPVPSVPTGPPLHGPSVLTPICLNPHPPTYTYIPLPTPVTTESCWHASLCPTYCLLATEVPDPNQQFSDELLTPKKIAWLQQITTNKRAPVLLSSDLSLPDLCLWYGCLKYCLESL